MDSERVSRREVVNMAREMTPQQCQSIRFAGRSKATFFDLSPLRTFRGAWSREDEIDGEGQNGSQNKQGHDQDTAGPAPVAFKEVGGGHGRLS